MMTVITVMRCLRMTVLFVIYFLFVCDGTVASHSTFEHTGLECNVLLMVIRIRLYYVLNHASSFDVQDVS